MYNTVSQLYNGLLGICFNKNNELSDPKRNKINHKYEPKKVSFKTYNYDSGLKMKNRLIQQEKVIKKNPQIL